MENICVSCLTPKAKLVCVGFEGCLCKSCATFVDENTFPFLKALPEGLVTGSYCVECYGEKAKPTVDDYEDKMEQARNISVYMKNQGKEVTALRRAQFPVKVDGCEDKAEALLRLAFLTVAEGYDTIIHVELNARKVKDGSFQTSVWMGQGTPAERRKRRVNR